MISRLYENEKGNQRSNNNEVENNQIGKMKKSFLKKMNLDDLNFMGNDIIILL